MAHWYHPTRYYHSGQSGPGSNDNEEALHVSQISKAEALPSDSFYHN